MANWYFERECRTPYSEVYTILEDDAPIGRLDLHFTYGVVHATLCVDESLTRQTVHELLQNIDDELLDAVGISREEFIVHVHQGTDLGVFTNHELGENGGGEH